MVKFRYTGKQPILVGHKFIYQGEVHRVTPAQWAVLVARHGAALTLLDQSNDSASLGEPVVTHQSTSAPSVAYGAELEAHNQLLDERPTADPSGENLNNQTEKKPRKRAKAG